MGKAQPTSVWSKRRSSEALLELEVRQEEDPTVLSASGFSSREQTHRRFSKLENVRDNKAAQMNE